jgi:hypothetical protein
MSRQYAVSFDYVPNCEPADRLLPARERPERPDGRCVFLFQGNFAPGRGIDLLIGAWAQTDPRAVLQLRGPDNAYKEQMRQLAAATGLVGTRIFFPEAVAETALVAAAAEADVGVIPYTPMGTNYRYCCPNKMSQYMAAGLPILANHTEFVAATVRSAACGAVCVFARRDQLVQAVAGLCASAEARVALGRAGRDYFADTFNWNVASRTMYQRLTRATAHRAPEPLLLFAGVAQPEPPLRPERTVVETMTQAVESLVAVARAASQPADAPAAVVLPGQAPASPAQPRPLPWLYRATRALWRRMPDAVRRPLMSVARRVNRSVGV